MQRLLRQRTRLRHAPATRPESGSASALQTQIARRCGLCLSCRRRCACRRHDDSIIDRLPLDSTSPLRPVSYVTLSKAASLMKLAPLTSNMTERVPLRLCHGTRGHPAAPPMALSTCLHTEHAQSAAATQLIRCWLWTANLPLADVT